LRKVEDKMRRTLEYKLKKDSSIVWQADEIRLLKKDEILEVIIPDRYVKGSDERTLKSYLGALGRRIDTNRYNFKLLPEGIVRVSRK